MRGYTKRTQGYRDTIPEPANTNGDQETAPNVPRVDATREEKLIPIDSKHSG